MDLEPHQIQKAQKMYLFLRGLMLQDPDVFRRANVKKCKKCDGTGLAGYSKRHAGDYSWTGQYCDECAGIGYQHLDGLLNLQIDDSTYICGKCYGVGCSNCKNTGKVDWISHSMGR